MLALLLAILVVLWLLGFINIQGFTLPNIILFNVNGQDVTLLNLLVLIIIVSVVGVLPSPLRQIAFVLVLLWVLSILGILTITGLPSVIVLVIIIGLVLALLGVV